ncbi:tRNA uridine-5-carboxymethylaminomethyl(34) synthesis GTPase MnmE [Novosphingopyxis sp. YJ-S2-01]|uniref:tRNA uridine-5-carboxymethylaminomethyl(34) synthesis GTPase MnmE n=1 Tax=Novosphingopyxis sp. YJ-S2-01 TaxID=2794021 RepID=UPI0018DBEA5C|nr:tRNA uridine-5-carboxymethylaminomethyl(34) synthesis GTPase MnmE [Novosphingopyxis sp. YJ-S2-01]
MMDTIFALSSGAPPAGIAVIRISGPQASHALSLLAGDEIKSRQLTYRQLAGPDGAILDQSLVTIFPGPRSATGEDLAELHLHGGRAVVNAVLEALGSIEGLRPAEAGEFTRRAFANGRIDLGQAEALSDLLSAETEWQRRAAIDMASSRFGRLVDAWRERLLLLSAMVEADLDFSDEDDVSGSSAELVDAGRLAAEIRDTLDAPPAERLRDGIRVVLAGPPNSGKSSLLNALVSREAAIVSDEAGTTRDVIEVPVAFGGLAFLLSDTAGLRESTANRIESIGIERARSTFDRADILLWLGEEGEGPAHAALIEIAAKSDVGGVKSIDVLRVSAHTREGVDELIALLVHRGRSLVPSENQFALNARQRAALQDAAIAFETATRLADPLMQAEELRHARLAFDRLTGRTNTEDMLDRIFSGFCIGK